MPRRSQSQRQNQSQNKSQSQGQGQNQSQSKNQSQNSPSISNETQGIKFTYSENFNKITELNTENFISWKISMLHFLDMNNLIDYIISEKLVKFKINRIENLDNYIIDKINPTLAYRDDTDPNDVKKDNITKWIILNSLGENTKKLIEARGKTAYESWKILEDSFTKGKEQLFAEITEKLNNLKYDSIIDINIFIATLENLFDELEYINKPLSEESKVGTFNRSLPENLRWINVFQFKDSWLKCREFATKVIPGIIFSNIKEKNNNKTENKSSFSSERIKYNKFKKFNNKRRKERCKICKKYGHSTKNCYFNKHNNNNKRKVNNKFKHNKSHNEYKKLNSNKYEYKNAHTLITKNKNNYNKYKNEYIDAFTHDFNSKLNYESNYIEKSNSTITTKSSNDLSLWTLDSGASVHITYHPNILNNLKPHKETIYFADGEKVTSTHSGDVIGYINNNEIKLFNVLLVPDFRKNLISICQLIENGYKTIFNSYNKRPTVTIYDATGKRIFNTLACNYTNTFKVWIQKCKTNEINKINNNLCSITDNFKNNNNYTIWHRRLGHFEIKNVINKLPKINSNFKCEICSKSKLKNKPFHDAQNKTKEPLELIHFDLIGPISESIYEKKYVFTILDDFTRFNWVIFLKDKKETFDKFIEWFNEITNTLDKRIKFIKSDNGKEFLFQ